MAFQTVPINITGPSYQSRSRPLSSQQTVHFYQQFNEGGKDKYVLLPFPGLKELGASITEIDRGLTSMNEIAYQVKGTTLYSITKFGVYTAVGAIPGTSRCIFANDGINLFIVSSSDKKIYQYNSTSILEVTDPNVVGSKSVSFFNNQFIYTGDKFSTVSDVGNGAVANGLNIIGAESQPDGLVRDYWFDQVIWRFGVRTTEGWYNLGEGSPPIARLDGQIFNVGLGAIHSVANTDEAMYWLADDHSIYQSSGGSKKRISTDAISNTISEMSVIDDAIGYTITFEGQSFYCLIFPTGNKTFVVNESLGENGWFELSTGIHGDKYQGTSLVNAYGKNIVADINNGKVYTLDFNTFTNNGEPLKRRRTTSSINGDLLGKKGARVQMSRVEFIMETGVGVIDGQGDKPQIMIEASFDGGRTWNTGTWANVGRLGEFVLKVEWYGMSTFYDCILRLSTTDPVPYSIYSAAIDLRLAGV